MNSHSYLTRKLRSGSPLGPEDISRLDRLTDRARDIPAGADMIHEGSEPNYVHFIRSGVACRYKMIEDGRRAIVALLLPGDFCDLHISLLNKMDHSIGALTHCEVTKVASGDLSDMLRDFPAIDRGFTWATLVDEAVLREWVANGRRSSERQLAHLFCELYTRFNAIGLTEDHTFRMPFTHAMLGDLLGISTVHAQRMMALLRDRGLISQQGGNIRLLDLGALVNLGDFDPIYLHLSPAPSIS